MTYDVSFIAPNNKLNVASLLDLIWYRYSNVSFGVAGHDFDYALVCVCMAEIDSTK